MSNCVRSPQASSSQRQHRGEAPTGLRSLASTVRQELSGAASWEEACAAAGDLVQRLTRARWAGVMDQQDNQELRYLPPHREPEALTGDWLHQLHGTARQSLSESRAAHSAADADLSIIAAPIAIDAGSTASLAAAFHLGSQGIEPFVLVVQLVAAELACWWHIREGHTQQEQTRWLAAIVELTSAVAVAETGGLQMLVNLARDFTGCSMVALATTAGNRHCKLRVVSEAGAVATATDLGRALEDALEEARLHGAAVHVGPHENSAESLPAHERLGELCGFDQITTVPLRTAGGECCALWTFVGPPERLSAAELTGWLAAATEPVASTIELVNRCRESRWAYVCRMAWQTARSRWGLAAGFLAALTLAAGVMIRVPYRVSAPCLLQPVLRRVVAAPFAGTLERSFVKPGDRVQEGQVLARMDGGELRTELAALTAELLRAGKDREVNLAAGKVAGAQIAALEIERLQQRRDLLLRRIGQLEIRCPRDGLILAGDLERSAGVPVSIGQPLFEVAPLERMVCELAVPHDEIAHVQVGQNVRLSLDAYGQAWTGKLTAVQPRAEIRDAQNVFVAELELENPEALLRPGMKGKSKITTGPQSLAWIVLHRPWQRLKSWF